LILEQAYYNYDKLVTKEEFNRERQRILKERFEKLENDDDLIDDEDLDYYLEELGIIEKDYTRL
jgi:Ca2+-binding EF-hand superfamily protein